LPVLAAALWWGSLSAIGFLAVPLLFANLPTPAMAGQLAARLFAGQAWVSIACALLVVVSARRGESPSLDWGRGALPFVMAGVLLALLLEFAVAPRIAARIDLKLWHPVGSAMFLAQWACAATVLWRLAVPANPPGAS
jgi:hypothetical protein